MIQRLLVKHANVLLSQLAIIFLVVTVADGQQKQRIAPQNLLTQKITRHEQQRFSYGGTVTLLGAPEGAITVEGWQRNEIEVTAEIELRAESEEDLRRLAQVNGFVFDWEPNHVRLLSMGTHDRAFMKRVAKDFPKRLLGLPWGINYRIRVPVSTDLEIDAGRGPIKVVGVEGAIRLAATETETTLIVTGGTLTATIAAGRVNLSVPVRSWRGAGIEVRLAAGEVNVELPSGFNGDIDAEILRTGGIKDSFGELQTRDTPGLTERLARVRAGAGGASFRFTVGDGTVSFKKAAN